MEDHQSMISGLDGVVKFEVEHRETALGANELDSVSADLLGWRVILYSLDLVGQDPQRYQGVGFGNLSARLPPFIAAKGRNAFVITGTQTGGKARLGPNDLSVVTAYDFQHNWVQSHGLSRPSSESLTHAAVYEACMEARFVFHAHAPILWRAANNLGLPATPHDIVCGTQQMAIAVQHLLAATRVMQVDVFAMAGHEDGVVSLGTSARQAGSSLLGALAFVYGCETGAGTIPSSTKLLQ